MASKSSRRRSVTAAAGSPADIASLLRDGRRFEAPSLALSAAAERLEQIGVLRPERCAFVRCNDPLDTAAPRSSRHCRGKIYVDDRLDESGHELRCPACERAVFPKRRSMRRHEELCTHVVPAGAMRFVEERLSGIGGTLKSLADGVWRVELGGVEVFVCVVDSCPTEPYLDRAWAKTRIVGYVAVDSVRLRTGFLNEEWVTRIALADLVTGAADLTDEIQRLADDGPPRNVSEPTVHVYAHRASPGLPPRSTDAPRPKRFLVEVGPGTVWVDGVAVVPPAADSRFDIFSILWERFLDDLRECREPDVFTWLTVDAIATRLATIRQREFPDVGSVRKGINRLQADIETGLKKTLGTPVTRTDVVESASTSGGSAKTVQGYRINPRTVVLRALRTPLT